MAADVYDSGLGVRVLTLTPAMNCLADGSHGLIRQDFELDFVTGQLVCAGQSKLEGNQA